MANNFKLKWVVSFQCLPLHSTGPSFRHFSSTPLLDGVNGSSMEGAGGTQTDSGLWPSVTRDVGPEVSGDGHFIAILDILDMSAQRFGMGEIIQLN